MKLSNSLSLLAVTCASSHAFTISSKTSTLTSLYQHKSGMDLSGNSWKPDSEKMGSTDTGDYFPEGYEGAEVDFTEGMMGSQNLGGDRGGPELPGLENIGADAIMMGGIEENSDIPAGMEFVAASVPDGTFDMQVAASSKGGDMEIEVKPFCMGFEDYFASFTADSHPSLKVSPSAGRMDRRGGESTYLIVECTPGGKSGSFTGDLVVNLPEDNSKLSYKINVNSF